MNAYPTIDDAVQRLRQGGVVAFPTETVYGLGALAADERAVARVFELKGRPSHNPLIVHVTGPEMGARVGVMDDPRAMALSRAFWPGPLTIVVPSRGKLPGAVTAGGETVALRSPDHPVAQALLFKLGEPLVGPSANRSGGVSPTRSEHVREAWGEDQVMVLEGGACRGGIESTVVYLGEGHARVLRPGLITPAEIRAVIGDCVMQVGGSETHTANPGVLLSPGMLARHYAPATLTRLVPFGELSNRELSDAAVLAFGVCEARASRVMPEDAEGYAAGLYEALRWADGQGAREILVELPSPELLSASELWAAILDRVRRAAES